MKFGLEKRRSLIILEQYVNYMNVIQVAHPRSDGAKHGSHLPT